jgi:glucose dehydrogenase
MRLNGAVERRVGERPSRARYLLATGGRAALVVLLGTIAAASYSAAAADDAEWPISAKNYVNTRYSELTQINAENVKSLKLAWTFDTGVRRGQEAAPIVDGQTMYVVTPYPNVLYALDLN